MNPYFRMMNCACWISMKFHLPLRSSFNGYWRVTVNETLHWTEDETAIVALASFYRFYFARYNKKNFCYEWGKDKSRTGDSGMLCSRLYDIVGARLRSWAFVLFSPRFCVQPETNKATLWWSTSSGMIHSVLLNSVSYSGIRWLANTAKIPVSYAANEKIWSLSPILLWRMRFYPLECTRVSCIILSDTPPMGKPGEASQVTDIVLIPN